MAKRNKARVPLTSLNVLENSNCCGGSICKKNFYHNHVRPTFCKNPHFWWKNVNKIVGEKKQSITLFDPKTDHPMDEKQAAEHINEFFASLT
jgi:hypothetical protein